MSRPQMRARTNGECDVPSPAGRLGYVLALIDDRDDTIRAQCEQVVIDLAKDRLRQTILEMHTTMRVHKVVGVVVTKERREAKTFDVEISVRQAPGATGAERGRDARS